MDFRVFLCLVFVSFFMKVLQWNAQSIRAHGVEFKKFIFDETDQYDVVCIQESWLKKGDNFKLKNYDIVRKDRLKLAVNGVGRGGVFTCVRRGLSYKVIDLKSQGIEVLGVEIFNDDRTTITVVNIYNPCLQIGDDELANVLDGIEGSVLICGDLNGHNHLWGGKHNDRNGQVIEDFINNSDLVCLNDGSGTRIDKRTGKMSCLDLSIISNSCAAKCSWRVEENCWDSDHFPISIGIFDKVFCNVFRRPPTWAIKRANWDKFDENCINKISSPDEELLTDDIYDKFISQLTDAINDAIPKTRPYSQRKSPVPWWSKSCDDAIKDKKRALNKLKRSGASDDYIDFKKKRAKARQVVKDAKRKHWHDFCGGISSGTPTKIIWDKIKSISNNRVNRSIPCLNKDGQDAVTDDEKANMLVNSFAAVSSTSNYDLEFQDNKEQVESDFSISNDDIGLPINDKFTLNELDNAIDRAGCTTPGADNIGASIIKHLPKITRQILLIIINIIWLRGECPSTWKEAILTPIAKPGKDSSSPLSYRPIALTSTLGKIMERMVKFRLDWFLERNHFIHPAQSGFRTGRKTTDHIVQLENAIQSGFANKESTLVVFLDFEKAYDMIWHVGVLIKMQGMGLKGRIIRWMDDFLKNRYIRVKVNGTFSGFKYVDNGVPQGSVLSPTIFNIAVSDLPNCLPSNIDISQFADDGSIRKTGRNIDFLVKSIQTGCNSITDWCKKWGFKLSGPKSVGVLFTLKKKIPNISLHVFGSDITMKKSTKFLGVLFDSRLTWADHIEYVINRCKPRINLLRCISGCKWGATCFSLLNVYKATIEPVLEYGCEAFDSASISVKNRLNSIQYQALKICAGAVNRTSLVKLQIECGVPPLQLKRNQLSAMFATNIYGNRFNPTSKVLNDCWQRHYFKDNWIKGGRIPFCARAEIVCDNVISVTANFPFWYYSKMEVYWTILQELRGVDDIYFKREMALKNINGKWSTALHVYTDGSMDSIRNRVGCGFYIPAFKYAKGFRLSDVVSIFSAELMAIYLALLWIAEVAPSNVCIFSDCVSALQALIHFIPSNGIVRDIQHLVMSLLQQGIFINFDWVPGHCGIYGNDRADFLAKEATNNKRIDVNFSPNSSEIKHVAKSILLKKWQSTWDEFGVMDTLKMVKPRVCHRMLSWGGNREDEVIFHRLRMGFGRSLNSYLVLIDKHPNGLCDRCGVLDSVSHFLLKCIKYRSQRMGLIDKIQGKCFSLSGLLSGGDPPFKEVVEFVKKCKIDI